MGKVLIISCNDSYDYHTRTKYVKDYFQKRGYKVEFLTADFDHRSKARYRAKRKDTMHYIHVKSYKRNLSISRILSHIQFAKGVRDYLKHNSYELIYHCAPPNYTIKELSHYKKKNSDVFLITEIGDMWPETLPIPKIAKRLCYIPLKIWENLRNKNLNNSDILITECNLFQAMIESKAHAAAKTLYFCKPFAGRDNFICPDFGLEMKLCYLGSINNIVDIDVIACLVKVISAGRRVTVDIIGDGEKRERLVSEIKKNGAEAVFHGMIFDEYRKRDVLEKCHFALNIMKPQVCVGMTMKSLDYFSYGIPVINNIGGDIKELVSRERVGINLDISNSRTLDCILHMTERDYLEMRGRMKDFHNQYFSVEGFDRSMDRLLKMEEI